MATVIIRAPLLIATAFAMNQSFIRPNPAAAGEERQTPSNAIEHIFVRCISGLTYVARSIAWIPACADMCMVLHASRGVVPNSWVRPIDALPFNSASVGLRGVSGFLIAGTTVAVASAYLRRWAMSTLGKHFTLELTLQPKHELVTAPPYNIVRHPSYTGGLGVALGAAMAFCAPTDGWFRAVWLPYLSSSSGPALQRGIATGFTVAVAAVFSLGVMAAFSRTGVEDRMLRERFGKDWDMWAAQVPSKLIPGIF